MMFRHAIIAFFVLAAVLAALPAWADDKPAAGEGIIGTIMDVEGSATITPAGSQSAKALALKDSIHMNDVIQTGAKSRVLVLFIDNTQVTLSEKSKLTVDQYVFDPDDSTSNKADYNFVAGTFQYVSGLIAKKKDPDVKIETPYGTIGIRGTKLWAGNLKDSYGVHVSEGKVSVKNDGGQVLVNKGEGTALKDRKTAPPKAAPFNDEQLKFIAETVFLADQAAVFDRILGFQGQQKALQGQFKNFLKFKGMPGNMKNMIPGNDNLPFGPKDKDKNKDKTNRKQGNRGGMPFGGGFPGAPSIPGFGGP